MKQFIKNLLDESTTLSTQRFALVTIIGLTVLLTIVNIVLCFMTANLIYIGALTELTFGLLGIAITGKVWQKFAENKAPTDTTK